MQEQIFDNVCLGFWASESSAGRTHKAAELIWRLASLQEGATVLDYGSGVGKIALALAKRGVRVTGVERSGAAMRQARRISHRHCSFVESDWENYRPDRRFDCTLFWRTTLCAGTDADFRALRYARRALKPGGCLLVETRHWDAIPRPFQSRTERCCALGRLVESHSYDPVSGVQATEEAYFVKGSRVNRLYHTRRYVFAELADMCRRAGYAHVDGFDGAGTTLTNLSERMVLRACTGAGEE